MSVGVLVGWKLFGFLGSFVGIILGLIVGSFVGRIPLWLVTTIFRRSLSNHSNEQLQQMFRSVDCSAPNIVLIEMQIRKMNVRSELPTILEMLIDEDSNRRVKGLAALMTVFPDLAEQIPDYQPLSSTESCRESLGPLHDAILDDS